MTRPDRFPADVPAFGEFARITDLESYVPVGDEWLVGLADVVSSTRAIEAGRYKAVNTAGAAVISAVCNALSTSDIPFVFQGDGSSFAIPPQDEAVVRDALAATATFVHEELDLELRVALIPVRDIREAGFDVKVARFAASPDASFTMFSGGGLAWAERASKAGRYSVAPAPPGTRPNLSGLSCRFDRLPSRNGVVLSIIERPCLEAPLAAYREAVKDIVGLVESSGSDANPVSEEALRPSLDPTDLTMEAKVHGVPPGKGGWRVWIETALKSLHHRTALWLGPRATPSALIRYIAHLVVNSDYRKYDDGLRMTLDCTPILADALEASLERARLAGLLSYGTHRQPAALMTCFTPALGSDNHVHFVDGAGGGYAMAADRLKAALPR